MTCTIDNLSDDSFCKERKHFLFGVDCDLEAQRMMQTIYDKPLHRTSCAIANDVCHPNTDNDLWKIVTLHQDMQKLFGNMTHGWQNGDIIRLHSSSSSRSSMAKGQCQTVLNSILDKIEWYSNEELCGVEMYKDSSWRLSVGRRHGPCFCEFSKIESIQLYDFP